MELPVPSGPLAVRWLAWTLEEPHAGSLVSARLGIENAGTAAWRPGRVKLSYHWLDERGNPIVWDGIRTRLERPLGPGERLEQDAQLRGPLLPPLGPNAEVGGLPAWRPEGDEPWLYDGRITARLRAGRRRA